MAAEDVRPHVSVVIPALNAEATIGEQLAALAHSDFDEPWELIIVDNGSDDRTAAIAEMAPSHRCCDLRIVRVPQRGLNVARNAGIAAAKSDIIAICDADDVVTPTWLRGMVDALGAADMAGGDLDVTKVNSAGVIRLRGWPLEEQQIPGTGREFRFLEQVTGCSMSFRRSLWIRLGGFDESFTTGGDDVDFAWRVQLAGGRLVRAPFAVLHYRARDDVRAMWRQYVRDGEGAAHLYSVFGSLGMPRRTSGQLMATIGWLARTAIRTPWHDASGRGHFVRVAGKQWGRLRGSARHRVWYP